jgi:hypothetical protein
MSAVAIQITQDHDLFSDRYWRGLLYLFGSNPKLQQYFTTYFFDLEAGVVRTLELKKRSRSWSNSERFLLDLACHLYNENHKVNLSDMDLLDQSNKELALSAIRLRFG